MSRRQRETPLEPTLSVNEIAEVLNVSRPVVYRLMRDDPTFETFRAGARIRMRQSVLRAWIEKAEQKEKVA